ncbi:MAG: membrane fusion-like protein [Pseudomonadota bacterium]
MKSRTPSPLAATIGHISRILGLAILGTVTTTTTLAAQSISVEQVSHYDLRPQQAKKAERVSFPPVTGRYQATPGSMLTLPNPFENAAVNYLIVDGQKVEDGTLIAQLHGPSVEHFFHRVETIKEQYDVAAKQYQSKKQLYQKNAIAADEWQQFLTHYISLSDTLHDVNVVLRRVTQTSEQSAKLIAKESGIWRNSHNDQELGTLLTRARLAIVAEVPVEQAHRITSLEVNSKQLQVRQREQTVRNGFVRLWSEPPRQTDWIIGQRFTVEPQSIIDDAYRVPASSIATLKDQAVIFTIENATITAVAVELLSFRDGHYFIQSTAPLNNIATHSVAALKVLAKEQEAQ